MNNQARQAGVTKPNKKGTATDFEFPVNQPRSNVSIPASQGTAVRARERRAAQNPQLAAFRALHAHRVRAHQLGIRGLDTGGGILRVSQAQRAAAPEPAQRGCILLSREIEREESH